MKKIFLSASIVVIAGCHSPGSASASNIPGSGPGLSKDSVASRPAVDAAYTAVIEIPAGTNKKIEQDKETLKFETDQREGKDRVIQFLPYPANYGFIKGTLSDKAKGGDGDPVDVLVIAESIPTGTEISVIPVATLQLIDDGEEDYKIVAVPAITTLNVLSATDLGAIRNWKAIQSIIETWFSNYDTDPAHIQGWLDQEQTIQYIRDNHQP